MSNFAREELQMLNQFLSGLFLMALSAYALTRFQDTFPTVYFVLAGIGLSVLSMVLFKSRYWIFGFATAVTTIVFALAYGL